MFTDTAFTRLQIKGHFTFIFIKKSSGMNIYIYVKADMINNVQENILKLVNLIYTHTQFIQFPFLKYTFY